MKSCKYSGFLIVILCVTTPMYLLACVGLTDRNAGAAWVAVYGGITLAILFAVSFIWAPVNLIIVRLKKIKITDEVEKVCWVVNIVQTLVLIILSVIILKLS